MDEIDLAISLMLMANSRTSYTDLADKFNMSVNSVHKRVKSLVDLGIIQNFKTRLGFSYFPETINVLMFGRTKVKDKKNLMDRLGKHDSIYNVTQASGNLIYIHSYIRSFAGLDSLVSFVREKGEIDTLTIGLDKNSPANLLKGTKKSILSQLDYLIIYSLKANSRKPISEIARELGYSSKTIRRHLEDLIEQYSILFTVDWYPDKTSDICSFIILNIKRDMETDENVLLRDLRQKYGQKIVFTWTFSNLPKLIIIFVWTQSMKELQDIETDLMEQNFESVDVTILIEGKMYSTWINEYLDDKVREIKSSSL
ncbi:MAG: winged helix-turn-helix transcriptional regulator [Promethearchaeota archaeon]